MGLFKRIGSWSAGLTPEDKQFVNSYLDDPGKFLFYQMSKVDQHHALAVARAIVVEVSNTKGLEIKTLIKAALLHDVGKVEGDYNFFSRILVGFVKRFQPALRDKYAFRNPNTFWEKVRYGFYVDLVHPARGAHMAKVFGIEREVVEMIRHHHDPPYQGQSAELTWLQLADSKN
jgi:putative nucleotidyltransferase with HDIG domain